MPEVGSTTLLSGSSLRADPSCRGLRARPHVLVRPPVWKSYPRKAHQRCCLSTAGSSHGVVVDVRVEVSQRNSRILAAAVDVQAPVEVVWDCLTDYEHLQEFIPGLVENECLERRPEGALLRQVGAQDVAMGIRFCALAVLDIVEHLHGLAKASCWELSGPNVPSCTMWDEDLGMFPCPGSAANGISPRDLSFVLVEGDFQAFRGLWRMQGVATDPNFTRLSYSVFVRPQRWLPVSLIEKRIVRESQKNLIAVREHAQHIFRMAEEASRSKNGNQS